MSDDLGKKVQQIVQMLGQENVPDNLKELVTLLASSLGKKEDNIGQPASSDADTVEKPANTDTVEKSSNPESAVSTEMLDTASNTLNRLNTGSDPRINLLQAIKPFMNNKRQKKIGNCIQLLQVASLSRLLNEHEK